jgi:hypothetical protein
MRLALRLRLKRWVGVIGLIGLSLLRGGGLEARGATVTESGAPDFEQVAAPFFARHCTGCHGGDSPKGGLNLAALDHTSLEKNRKLWRRIRESVEGGIMPPEERPQPTPEELEDLIRWLDGEAKKVDCSSAVDPGRVTIRRLNRVEYNNTIRDLVGVDYQPGDDFPSDDVGYGFDNIGDVLTLPPLLMEKYLAAAEVIAERAIVAPETARAAVTSYRGSALAGAGGEEFGGIGRILASDGEIAVTHDIPRDGEYLVRIVAFGQQAGGQPARMELRIDGSRQAGFDVEAIEGDPARYEHRVVLTAGSRRVAAAFVNDYYQPDEPDPSRRDRNLIVEAIEIEGPAPTPDDPLPESHRRIVFKTPSGPEDFDACAAEVVGRFATRAFRRPVSGGELGKLLRFVDLARENGDSFERGIQLAVQAALISPQFLYRVELNRGRSDRREGENGRPNSQALGEYEVASRLSYFLWSSMPDDELFTLAEEKRLLREEVLEGQVERMLRDPKSRALVENFAGQWLQLRNLRTVSPDREQFPEFDEALREAMRIETELFFESVMREDRSLLEFLDSDFTFLNERLARHYGIPGVVGAEFRRVQLPDSRRGGLITQASILTITSNPTRTSPVKRGKWILEQILGTPPPPPPPDVPELADDQGGPLTGTLRQRMEQHRTNPNCAVCHNRLDPPGFGLENFDAIGAWRDREGDQPIDASGTFPSGEAFQGPGELKALLRKRGREFARSLTEKMLIYSLGRGLEETDLCVVDGIVEKLAQDEFRFSRLVREIVRSDPFLRRRL